MDKTLAGVIGAVTALATAAPSHATVPAPLTADAVLSVSSYADLLKPIPNALAILKEVSATGAMQNSAAPASGEEAGVLEAQYSYHHHHHHRFFRRRYYHHHHYHHHHHHHHAYYGERFFGLSSISPEADRD